MPEDVLRTQQLELLRPLRSISPQGARGLAMLAKGVSLANAPADDSDDEGSVSGSLISYCVRDAIDSIFPRLADPKIRDAAQRVVSRWHRATVRSSTDLAGAMRVDIESLERAVDAATSGFLPRASALLGVLNPTLPADIGIPAMRTLHDLNKAANDGTHGSVTLSDAVALLDQVLERLVELVAPLAVTVPQYQALVDTGDFQGVASLLATNSDPRIRVYLFDRVQDPLLAQALDVADLLPGLSVWFAFGYVRHLAKDHGAAFRVFIGRVIAKNKMTAEVAAQLLICATYAGADAAADVDRLGRKAGRLMRTELVTRWLRAEVDVVPKILWWKILISLVGNLEASTRAFDAPHGLDELFSLAMSRLLDIAPKTRSTFAAAIIAALARLDTESPYTVVVHFDNMHLRPRTTSSLLIDATLRMIALSEVRGEKADLSAFSDLSRRALERAAVPATIEVAPPAIAETIARQAVDGILARITAEEWPDDTDLGTLGTILPLAGPNATARIVTALGDPPSIPQLRDDLDNASESRADWFRLAQWAAHLPESTRPALWAAALGEAAVHGFEFGPLRSVDRMATPRKQDSPLGNVDIPNTTVPDFVTLLNTALGMTEPDDPRFALKLQETIAAHTSAHRNTWASDHNAIVQVRDLWARLAIIRALKSESNDAPRLRWDQLRELWKNLVHEASVLESNGADAAKPAASRIAGEILEHLSHRVAERPRTAADINWWADEVLPVVVPMLAWIGADEHNSGVPALFSLRGQTVRLLVTLSSPIDDDAARNAALSRALDLLATAAQTDAGFARSIGHWASWLMRRDPDWWERHADRLAGTDSLPEIHQALLTANWESNDFAFGLLDRDVGMLNSFAGQANQGAAYPALTAVLFNVLPIARIEEPTWSAIFRNDGAAEDALRYLFPDWLIPEDPQATRRLEILRWIVSDKTRARAVWRSMNALARSPDLSDNGLFAFTAELAQSNRGAPTSTYVLADRLVRSLTNSHAVETLEAMCAGNLGDIRAMAQYDMEAVHAWFQGEGQQLPEGLRVRVRQALFEVGFVDGTAA
jgi:hypothetical protein